SIGCPPGRTLPDNASCSVFERISSFDLFTEVMLKSTMKSAISSVIMSAYVSSQRSSLSLWAAAACRRPPLCDRRALIGLSGRGQLGLYGGHAFGLQGGLGF